MALTIAQLFEPAVLTTAAATLYTCPTSPTSNVLRNGRIRFANTTGGAVTITAYAVKVGGTAGAGNAFMTTQSLAANSFIDVDLPMLGPGDFFQALASANTSITCFAIDGVLFS